MAKKNLEKQATRAKEVLDGIEAKTAERKGLYEELDTLIVGFAAVPAEELAAHGLVVTDAFAKGNTQWGHGPVRRLSLERIEAPAAAATEKPAKKPRASADKKA
jgi:hypothetical protein